MNHSQAILFGSSPATARALRSGINASFADSLSEVFRACAGHVEIPEARAERLIGRLNAGRRETPYLYSLFFAILSAIERDDLASLQTLIDRLLAAEPAKPGVLITSLIPDQFPWDAEMVSGFFAAEADSVFRYVAPPHELVAGRTGQIREALNLMSACAPDLMAETEELVTTIILARAVEDTGSGDIAAFQGSSALRAFGGIIFDIEPDPTVVDTIALFVHEAAHNMLFALSPKEGVVRNGDDERFSSPLRDDLRPLEGIFHAVFVLARMAYALELLRSSGRLTEDQAARATEMLSGSTRLFDDGLRTLQRHADLTPEGEFALKSAERYMAGVAA
ncbi:HEXXH motif-containing putative peptide modification protein [Oricola sp.]|uniref:aKG-HExxH-type peptide beta-hydroxylase n=1 Tax=Oricola sp. TaxID=1979950 RepID=UPI0025E3F76E|nr:HEXXH motif-containing putative peptide modification protein [Oricola sp.]MCI5075055.1 HEXXH motif-containing putative peptide modification protein [Oricola sp.]